MFSVPKHYVAWHVVCASMCISTDYHLAWPSLGMQAAYSFRLISADIAVSADCDMLRLVVLEPSWLAVLKGAVPCS